MFFCEKCDNMYYIKLNEEDNNSIMYYCKNCGNTNNNLLELGKCVYKEKFNGNNTYININKYSVLDNTLPRINSIKCPNQTCESNEPDFDTTNREIIFIRNDHTNLKYMYLCSHCNYNWSINN